MPIQTCRTCGAEVVWIKSLAGKPQILDAEFQQVFVTEKPERPGLRRIALVGSDGAMESGYLSSVTNPNAYRIEGHTSHWSSCTSPPPRKPRA